MSAKAARRQRLHTRPLGLRAEVVVTRIEPNRADIEG
jgi:hypothetical protein